MQLSYIPVGDLYHFFRNICSDNLAFEKLFSYSRIALLIYFVTRIVANIFCHYIILLLHHLLYCAESLFDVV